ncbi:hypothetical protein Tco_1345956 [Tanacetum coccineum]
MFKPPRALSDSYGSGNSFGTSTLLVVEEGDGSKGGTKSLSNRQILRIRNDIAITGQIIQIVYSSHRHPDHRLDKQHCGNDSSERCVFSRSSSSISSLSPLNRCEQQPVKNDIILLLLVSCGSIFRLWDGWLWRINVVVNGGLVLQLVKDPDMDEHDVLKFGVLVSMKLINIGSMQVFNQFDISNKFARFIRRVFVNLVLSEIAPNGIS